MTKIHSSGKSHQVSHNKAHQSQNAAKKPETKKPEETKKPDETKKPEESIKPEENKKPLDNKEIREILKPDDSEEPKEPKEPKDKDDTQKPDEEKEKLQQQIDELKKQLEEIKKLLEEQKSGESGGCSGGGGSGGSEGGPQAGGPQGINPAQGIQPNQNPNDPNQMILLDIMQVLQAEQNGGMGLQQAVNKLKQNYMMVKMMNLPLKPEIDQMAQQILQKYGGLGIGTNPLLGNQLAAGLNPTQAVNPLNNIQQPQTQGINF